MEPLRLKFKKLHPTFELPVFATRGAACFDLCYCGDEEIELRPGRALVPLGCAVEVPEGWELQLRPRSGLAIKHGITILNSPGTIDSDYRGEIKACLANNTNDVFYIQPGMRVCQARLAQVFPTEFEMVEELGETERAGGGFGSTGV